MPTVRLDQLELHTLDAGSGPPLVLIHGFPLTHEMWGRQIPALAGSHRVIAPDLRGFGMSTRVPGEISMATYAADIAALLDRLDVREPAALAGFSMGGYIAFAFLRDFAPRVRALALVDTKATADTPEGRIGRAEMAERVLADGSGVVAEAMIGKLLSPAAIEAQPELTEELLRMMRAQSPATIAQALAAMAGRPDSTPLLGEVAVPTLVIAGGEDEIASPVEASAMACALRDAELVEIAGVGHLAPMEAPQAVTEALTRWLGASGAGARSEVP